MSQFTLETALTEYASNEPEPERDLFTPYYEKIGKYNVRFVRHQKDDAPTLVMLNGLPQSIRMWEHGWETLSQNFDLLAFDIPGFGLTKGEEGDMSPRTLSNAVIQIMDHFEIQTAHLIGPDVGAPITLATAIQYPDRLHSINIFDGPGSYPPEMAPILKAVINYRLVRWLAKGLNKKAVMRDNFRAAVKDGYHHYRPTKRAINEYYDITHDEQNHKCSITFFGTYKQDLTWIHQRLKDMQIPTLITWGKHDPFVLVSNAEYLSKQIPSNKLTVFENASHFSSEDAGKDYLDEITNWCLEEYKQL